jgi:antitoxin (DNA-binding transcriptional repressor) of toxin-antitoxin stability system
MAIYPTYTNSPKSRMASTGAGHPIDIDAWTEKATEALLATSISQETTSRGATVALSIPLDPTVQKPGAAAASRGEAAKSVYTDGREPVRRDSLKRREALLKGREGSRRRQRWENGLCLSQFSFDAV